MTKYFVDQNNFLCVEVDGHITKLFSVEDENVPDVVAKLRALGIEVEVLNARVDTFASLPPGSTAGNAELVDIRVGADGTTYDTAGNAVREQLDQKMERYVIKLVKTGDSFKLTDYDGNDLTFSDVYDVTHQIKEYVVVLYGNSKLRPQYVSTNEIMFTGLDRSTDAKVLRIILTPTRLSYDTFVLAEASDLTALRSDISRLSESITEISEVTNYFKFSNQTVGNLSMICDVENNTITLNGTSPNVGTEFEGFTVPKGSYVLNSKGLSGTGGTIAVRYKDSEETTTSTTWKQNEVVTFDTPFVVLIKAGVGTYVDMVRSIVIKDADNPLSAVDFKLRKTISDIDNTVKRIDGAVEQVESDIDTIDSALTDISIDKLPCNYLSKYNAFTCVDKTKVKLSQDSRLLVFGDSITYGAEGIPWTTYIRDKFNCTVINRAVSGSLYGESVRTSNYWLSTRMANTSDSEYTSATLVVFALGTNDAGYDTTDVELKAKVQSAIDYVRERNANVPILFITPIKRGGTSKAVARERLPYFSGIIEHVALVNDCSVICGLNFPIPNIPEGVIDGLMGSGHIHPNDIGGRIYAQSIIDAIL